ncbi:MAG: PstS family phosphate ABC transporter substrate-binding protein [Acidimicrobiales bacterium]|nr:PstS family phosphate ABC transporter substrate-binding protein [Acidimicrobiales bacterium]
MKVPTTGECLLKKIRYLLAALVFASTAGLVACSKSDNNANVASGGTANSASPGAKLTGSIRVDGSSTVTPLIALAAEDFQAKNSGVTVTVGTSGTGGGFEKFCNGEIDIAMASRPIKEKEVDACKSKNIEPLELIVANDGLSVVINPQNDWVKCLTVKQLKAIWEPGSTVNNWNQVDPSFPDQPLKLFGPGSDSGTFDYFTKEINGEEGATRTDYNPTEDDNVTVSGVAGDKGALGYFGLSYLLENQGKVKGIAIDSGNGCIAPSTETVQSGQYKPLGRPLFIYLKPESAHRPEVKAFAEFYFDNQDAITKEARFVPLTKEQLAKADEELAKIKSQ